ncbi:hypothetical protein PHYSODRAFT_339296 [Phytophthora sojae]|uniref:BED-type domain-containing protein n=1 Tax=Phytophthora sojae (strain P6497) TaxID=1094619 RepID=G5A6B8_PHYSP|nr:hypothetical protein PHYSODRAFT_339296 [Phytophthora sojae]EGZ08873.1 hypothetical protein PHYSODRAFT_339296 [Phytophthora sojae]|eukprot:XP_009535506.1 hypothetical protein PHYSODRAFT_339296 [Phytophthora sojae]
MHRHAEAPEEWRRLKQWLPAELCRDNYVELPDDEWKLLHVLPYVLTMWGATPMGRTPHCARLVRHHEVRCGWAATHGLLPSALVGHPAQHGSSADVSPPQTRQSSAARLVQTTLRDTFLPQSPQAANKSRRKEFQRLKRKLAKARKREEKALASARLNNDRGMLASDRTFGLITQNGAQHLTGTKISQYCKRHMCTRQRSRKRGVNTLRVGGFVSVKVVLFTLTGVQRKMEKELKSLLQQLTLIMMVYNSICALPGTRSESSDPSKLARLLRQQRAALAADTPREDAIDDITARLDAISIRDAASTSRLEKIRQAISELQAERGKQRMKRRMRDHAWYDGKTTHTLFRSTSTKFTDNSVPTLVPDTSAPARDIHDKANIFADAWSPIFNQTPADPSAIDDPLRWTADNSFTDEIQRAVAADISEAEVAAAIDECAAGKACARTPRIPATRKPGRPKHFIWRYFEKITDGSAKPHAECHYCHVVVRSAQPGTNMQRHLKSCCSVPVAVKRIQDAFRDPQPSAAREPVPAAVGSTAAAPGGDVRDGHPAVPVPAPTPTQQQQFEMALAITIYLCALSFVLLFTESQFKTLLKNSASSVAAKAKLSQVKKTIRDQSFWSKLEQVVAFLDPIIEALRELESDNCSTSRVYSRFKWLLNHPAYGTDEVQSPIQAAIKGLVDKRWKHVHTDAIGLAFLLDPHTTLTDFVGTDEKDTIKQGCAFAERSGILDELGVTRAQFNGAMYSFASEKRKWTPAMWRDNEGAAPQDWWPTHANQYPMAWEIARLVFAIPPSSAASERAWSIMDFIHSKKRNRLAVDKVDMLASIYANHLAVSTEGADWARLHSYPESGEALEREATEQ